MTYDLHNLVGYGVGFVVFGLLGLAALVHFDLTRGLRLSLVQQAALAAGIGSGILAFTLKLTAIVILSNMSARAFIVTPALVAHAGDQPAGGEDLPREPDPWRPWRPLPAVAPSPPDNPTTPAKVALGETLFHDVNLSRDRTQSCASCHDVRAGAGDDGKPRAIGVAGLPGGRNAPTVFNTAFQKVLFWDGRAASLEEQAKGPLVHPLEMAMPDHKAVEARVAEAAAYRPAFDLAFGQGAPMDIDHIVKAIAAYERTLITPDAPYDRFVRGDAGALTRSQLRGMGLFQSVGCVRCHSGPNFSDAAMPTPFSSPFRTFPTHDDARVRRYRLDEDRGLAGAKADKGVWRVPSLRNVALTGPYFHNGAVSDLSEAVRIMAVVQANAALEDEARDRTVVDWRPESGQLASLAPTRLAARDIDDLVAFLRALTSDSLAARRATDERK